MVKTHVRKVGKKAQITQDDFPNPLYVNEESDGTRSTRTTRKQARTEVKKQDNAVRWK